MSSPPPKIEPSSPTAQKRLEALLATIRPPETRYYRQVPKCWVPVQEQPLRHPRKLRVVTIGGGISAMNLAYVVQHNKDMEEVVEHCIYEKNDVLGGTWWVNHYPGVACDVPAHIYTFPFEPNPEWSAFYAGGQEIHDYFSKTVKKYSLDRDVKTSHEIISAEFDEYEGIWNLKVNHNGQVFSDWCNVLVSATGFLSHWKWPDIPGLHEFNGLKVHSAAWDNDYDYSGKKIAMVGNGSSAIQIMPELAKHAKQVTNFIRNPTWITPGLGSAVIDGQINKVYSEDEKEIFRADPEALKAHRKEIQHGSNKAFDMFRKDSKAQRAAFEATSKMMLDRLGGNKELATKLTPDWEVGCRRATPGPGYLEAFTQPHVSLITDAISHITSTGITTQDGTHHSFDVIVCATGFDVSHRPLFPILGLNKLSLTEYWKDEPLAYLSLACPNFPNLFFFSGPNAPVGHGSLMAALSWSANYMARWLRKMATEDIKFVVPTEEATEQFNSYGDEIMQRLVWSGGCRSWYKNNRVNGRVTAVWAGSAIGYREVIQELRVEDFRIVWRTDNRFRWMGNGRTALEGKKGADLAFYLEK
ncbi:FAD/NAD(P)-binding domain-containing protein [Corynespora cassiicola Philippines]|uniref:FAD/NAD(P)-binding domain-containing protein n=1 Tax=Corynespora cassiicola Philippines TaxID=1448308 RepID=A0A2T2P571_CORCC|nr:FAD/NAD(P)-binding domain-containing protein [Corynespora cassiicola Philippines]